MKKKTSSPIEFFVAPTGNDRWSGKQASRPFATIERAQQAVRALRRQGAQSAPVRVELRGGTYELRRPLRFTTADSGSPPTTGNWGQFLGPERSITYAARPGERPVISGGRRVTGWKETTVHGQRAWVARCGGKFTQLWVNGRRATRTRLPKQGCFRIEKLLGSVFWKGDVHKVLFTGQDHFRFARGDLRAWRNVDDIEFVALHYWIESRIPFRNINPKTREAQLQWKSRMRLTDDHGQQGAQYYIENIFEELNEPGQWYHDRAREELYYLPRPGERIATSEIVAPRLNQLVVATDVAHLAFEGLTFSHSEWVPGREAHTATPQAACHIPGAIQFRNARQCAVRQCAVTHVGSYGIEIGDGSRDVEITGNRITDLAGGGVKVWHTPRRNARTRPGGGRDQESERTCRRVVVADNEIADGGHRWRQAVGVLVGKCSGNQIIHNHVHDFDYSGISVGWTWGYAESEAYGNIIEHNHIHDIGRGVLSDMGGIYLLGVAPGTRVRYNRIHDVESRGYGGWGIYLDEGSSHVLVENNLVYRTKSQGYHQHYGRENLIQNNIFALGREGQIQLSRIEPHPSFFVRRNIFLSDNGGRMIGNDWDGFQGAIDSNLYYDLTGKGMRFGSRGLRQWQRHGGDCHALVANPRFVNAAKNDFRLRPGSPALKLGFAPFALVVGPRKHTKCYDLSKS